MKARAFQLTTLGLLALLEACGGGNQPAPSPAPSPPPVNVNIEISQPWSSAQPADVHMDSV
jgi:ABC-type glycerol-3-phosphate transport system substrate-binding protein